MTVGSLFAGIGGFDLAAERVGWDIKWQVEIDPFCRRVLEKHWPQVRRYEDVRAVGSKVWADGIMDSMAAAGCGDAPSCPLTYHGLEPVDVICGGFPCQDISSNNQYKRGIGGEKSGLFREAVRVVRQLRPRYVVLENVADLLVRGMDSVLRELAALGLDAEWECLPAASFGLPQPRWRVFVVAYPGRGRCKAGHERLEVGPFAGARLDDDRLGAAEHAAAEGVARACGVDDGVPWRMDRIAALGNSVAPVEAEWIFRQIQAAEDERGAGMTAPDDGR